MPHCFIKATSYLSSCCQTGCRSAFISSQASACNHIACNHIAPVMIISITPPTLNLLNESPDNSELVITKSTPVLYFYKCGFYVKQQQWWFHWIIRTLQINSLSFDVSLHTVKKKKRKQPFRSCYNILQALLRGYTWHYHQFLCFCCSVSTFCRELSQSV